MPVLRPEVWRLARAVADRAAGIGERRAAPRDPAAAGAGREGLARARARRRRSPIEPAADHRVRRRLARGRARRRAARGAARPRARAWSQLPSGAWVGPLGGHARRRRPRALVAGGRTAILVRARLPRPGAARRRARARCSPAEAVARCDARQPNPDRYRALLRAADGPAGRARQPLGRLRARPSARAASRSGTTATRCSPSRSAPYVHARDAALIRQEQQGGALVFAGHTRTTEVERLVEVG